MNQKKTSTPRTYEETEHIKTQWKASGKSKKQFSAEQGINYMTFIGWFSRKKKENKTKPGFVPVRLTNDISKPFAEISFPKGHRVVFHQAVSAEYLQLILK